MRRRPFRLASDRRGTSAMEFALIAPLLLLFTGGIVELGGAYQKYVAVNRLATRYAIAWADCSDQPSGQCGLTPTSGVTSPELALYTSSFTEQNIAPQLQPVSGIGLRMMQISFSAGGSATTTYAYPSGTTPTAAELTIAHAVVANSQTGVVVTASYSYAPMFFSTLMKPFFGNGLVFSYTVAQLKS